MTTNSGELQAERVRWAELKPDEFRARQNACALAWLPFGLCEPHGHVAALGLDLLKAEAYCDETARRYGGIVAPALGWHIHESGYHARWLEDVVGNENAMMTSLPPHVLLHTFIYQLRACVNAGFTGVFVLSGHGGGNEKDLRRVAAAFAQETGLWVEAHTDAEVVAGRYQGDHAGAFEISQLMELDPSFVDLKQLNRGKEPGSGGRLALGDDAANSTAPRGKEINEAIVAALGGKVAVWRSAATPGAKLPLVSYEKTERIWRSVSSAGQPWTTARPYPGQAAVSENSQWKQGEFSL